MDNQTQAQLADKISAEQAHLQAKLADIETQRGHSRQLETVEDGAQAMAQQERARLEDEYRRARMRIQQLTRARIRLDEGEMGECSECGGDIPVKRLLFDPVITCCVDCQQAREVGAAQIA